MKKKIIIAIATILMSCNSGSRNPDLLIEESTEIPKSHDELKRELLNNERRNPSRFLSADGTYRESLFGNKFIINCNLHNTATIAAFKDIVICVTYYSKTGTKIGSNNYTIYEFIKPNSDVEVDLKIESYSDVSTIGWDVISAKPVH